MKRGGPLKRTSGPARTGGPKRKAGLARTNGLAAREQGLARRTPPKRAPISPASPAQRAKVAGKPCVHCGKPATTPMHLWPRGRGGCDDPLCVLPACWLCHRLFDEGKLDLLRDIVRDHKAEIAHAQLHTDPVSLLERLSASEVTLRSRIRAASAGTESRRAA